MISKMWYEVKKMVFESFDMMVETTFRIKDILKEQGILAKHGNSKNNGQSNNNEDKGKNSCWNRNKKVVNDGVVDSSKSNDQFVPHLVSANHQGSKSRYKARPKEGR